MNTTFFSHLSARSIYRRVVISLFVLSLLWLAFLHVLYFITLDDEVVYGRGLEPMRGTPLIYFALLLLCLQWPLVPLALFLGLHALCAPRRPATHFGVVFGLL